MLVRIATRGSAQALAQAGDVVARLDAVGCPTQLVVTDTLGDRTQASDVPIHSIGGQGVFVKEVQRAVLDGLADVAVHSAKDLPSATPDGLVIAAFLPRRSAADALVGARLIDLAQHAPVATGAIRRRAQLRAVRPDLEFVELRGNIHTRLQRVPEGGAIVMAVAALEVLGLTERIDEILDVDAFVPAVGQGCVAVECRSTDRAVREALTDVDDPDARHAVSTERWVLAELGAGCTLPIGAHATRTRLTGYLASADLLRSATESVALDGDSDADAATARRLARRLAAAVAGP